MYKKMIIIAVAVAIIVVVGVGVVLSKSDDKKEDITVTFTDGLDSDDTEKSETETEIEDVEEEKEEENKKVFPKDANGNDIDVTGYIDESTYMEYDDVEHDNSVTGGVSSEDYESLQNMTDEQRKLSEDIFESGEGAAPY